MGSLRRELDEPRAVRRQQRVDLAPIELGERDDGARRGRRGSRHGANA